MKKFFYIPCIIGATLLASCSSDNDFDNTPSPDDWSNTVTNSNVEIKLGTGSNGTRSSLGDEMDSLRLMAWECSVLPKTNSQMILN